MYTKLIVLLSLLLCSCTAKNNHPNVVKPFVKQFEDKYKISADHVDISFVDHYDDVKVVGWCSIVAGVVKVTFLKSYWNKSSNDTKTTLTFHELGHCILYRYHRNDRFQDGCYRSFMSTIIMNDVCFLRHKETLYNELTSFK